jgi:hypothetical protein
VQGLMPMGLASVPWIKATFFCFFCL